MAFQVSNILERGRGIKLNDVAMDSSKDMAAITETALTTASYCKLFERSDVINEQIHQSQFVAESN